VRGVSSVINFLPFFIFKIQPSLYYCCNQKKAFDIFTAGSCHRIGTYFLSRKVLNYADFTLTEQPRTPPHTLRTVTYGLKPWVKRYPSTTSELKGRMVAARNEDKNRPQ